MKIKDLTEAEFDFVGNNRTGEPVLSMEEAQQSLARAFPKVKQYTIARAEPGFRAMNLDGTLKSDVVDKVVKFGSSFKGFFDYLGLTKDQYLSGSQNVSPSLGYSWHTMSSPKKDYAILYYEDRGMGSDAIFIYAKNTNIIEDLRRELIDWGIVKDPMSAKNAKTAKRLAAIEKIGLKVGQYVSVVQSGRIYAVYKIVGFTPNGHVKGEVAYLADAWGRIEDMDKPPALGGTLGDIIQMTPFIARKNISDKSVLQKANAQNFGPKKWFKGSASTPDPVGMVQDQNGYWTKP